MEVFCYEEMWIDHVIHVFVIWTNFNKNYEELFCWKLNIYFSDIDLDQTINMLKLEVKAERAALAG